MSHPVSRTTGPITVSFSGFELCSLPWILLPTSLASGPHSIELNVRGCFVIQLSTYSVLSRSVLLPRKLLYFTIVLRICQELFSSFLLEIVLPVRHNLYILLYPIWFVKHFFILFCVSAKKSKREYGEGGIWTLAPRERSTPLAGAPLQPLEYFSKCLNIIKY